MPPAGLCATWGSIAHQEAGPSVLFRLHERVDENGAVLLTEQTLQTTAPHSPPPALPGHTTHPSTNSTQPATCWEPDTRPPRSCRARTNYGGMCPPVQVTARDSLQQQGSRQPAAEGPGRRCSGDAILGRVELGVLHPERPPRVGRSGDASGQLRTQRPERVVDLGSSPPIGCPRRTAAPSSSVPPASAPALSVSSCGSSSSSWCSGSSVVIRIPHPSGTGFGFSRRDTPERMTRDRPVSGRR